LLNVARVSPQKGLIYALRALPEILPQYPTVHLLSVGGTPDPAWRKQVEQEAAALVVADHFHLLGPRRDVIDFLRACDVFIFPSLYEGLGIALIEAMAAGCACVASSAGPIPEVVTDGEDGILVPPGNPQALAAAVSRLLSDESLRVRLGTAASETALRRFRPEESAATLTRIYQELLDQKTSKSSIARGNS
jgi:glycosyltransferase involved in cell wall biosynthesis